jgi:pimeloyl-ACP methyl ester carboxylesterase
MIHEAMRSIGSHALNVAEMANAGPPLLCLHGVTRCWQDWLTILPTLAPRWHCHGVDHRGHGLSDRTPGSYFVRDYLDDGCRLVDGLAEAAVLVGHSLGALVALGVAAKSPGKVRAVVLEDPPAPAFIHGITQSAYHAQFAGMQTLAGSQAPVRKVAHSLADIRLPTPEGETRFGEQRDAASLRFLAKCVKHLDPDVYTPILAGQWLHGIDLPALAKQVTCPVLLLRGNEKLGGMLPQALARPLVDALRDVTYLELPQHGHSIHGGDPQTFLRFVVPFLESLR